MGPDELQSYIWGALLDKARSQMPQSPVDYLGGLDNAPKPPQAPVIPIDPWTFNFGRNETTLSLPANHGANFEGYLNYSFNPFSPQNASINGGGLRYRYQY